ncbi:MAG: rod shape-determining protein MreD [Balneolaceae bacterium]|jgi:rod shape-determining protein MreD|nr:rod shape-determining protein MreD [Balneolaceae bacterium]
MRSENLRTFFIGLGIVAVQIVLMRHLQILGGESDLVLLYILWLCKHKTKTECLLYAAMLGFLQDAITDLWGLHMFSKALLVFILYGYLNHITQSRLIFWQVFLVILLAAFIHNVIFYGVSMFSELYASGYVGSSLIIVSTIFTAVVGSFLQLVREDI